MNNHYRLVIYVETRDIPEIVMKRKVCDSCGEGTFEFDLDTYGAHEYICGNCST
ncbi:MAG: hypothetical protein Q8O17_02710 [Candidatus Methanoperedens sp.]|nr:hypothetical protein [Candidatus Methanoperedens sp.]